MIRSFLLDIISIYASKSKIHVYKKNDSIEQKWIGGLKQMKLYCRGMCGFLPFSALLSPVTQLKVSTV